MLSNMNKFTQALSDYAEYLKANYNQRGYSRPDRQLTVEFDFGAKFIKVIVGHTGDTQRSSHSFIVINEYKGAKNTFKHGDILKSASWKAPAKNFARGNVLEKNYGTIAWCGA